MDNILTWDDFCAYSEIIYKLLKIDLECLIKNKTYKTKNNIIPAELLRLTGVGLMNNCQNDSPFESDGNGGIAIFSSSLKRVNSKEKIFERTSFGQKLVDIISK